MLFLNPILDLETSDAVFIRGMRNSLGLGSVDNFLFLFGTERTMFAWSIYVILIVPQTNC